MGVFTRSTKERLEELEAEEERLEAGIREEDYKMPHYTKEQILLTLAKFRDLDLTATQNRERLIDNLIGSILLYDDGKLIITFTFKDEPLTFSLDELNAVEQSSDINALASPKNNASQPGCVIFSSFT